MLFVAVKSEAQLHNTALARIKTRHSLENKVMLQLVFEVVIHLVGVASKNIAQKQRGSKGKRNADNPNSGNVTTEEDYKKAWDNAKEAERLNNLANEVEQALIRGAQYPKLSQDDIKKLEYKKPSMMGQYKRIMMRKGR